MPTSVVIAGGAGFIGSNLTRWYLARQESVLVLDNLCRGRRSFLADPPHPELLRIVETNLACPETLRPILAEHHARCPVRKVWHFAANSDIPAGVADMRIDLRDTFMTTFHLLEAMKELGLKRLAFASSSAVYGDHGTAPLYEETGPLLPLSNYGAMKLASEAIVSAAAERFLERAWIFRFPNVVGTPATHGVIMDFIRKLRTTPDVLNVLGNGTQRKVYLHVSEIIDAMLFIVNHSEERLNLFNIAPDDDGCTVRNIAKAVVDAASPGARIQVGSEDRGWVGDVPRYRYAVGKLKTLGWRARLSSCEAVQRAVHEILAQENY